MFVDVDAHLARMADAARHFTFASPLASARAALDELRATHASGCWRVRLLADRAGLARAQAFALAPTRAPVRVRLADRPLVGSDGEFVRFKTTHRAHYDALAPTDAAVFDTLLWNERGELTEFTRGNVALRIDGRWLTPAAKCGLLPGIARARLLREGAIEEAVLSREDLARANGRGVLQQPAGLAGCRSSDAHRCQVLNVAVSGLECCRPSALAIIRLTADTDMAASLAICPMVIPPAE